MSEVRNEGSHKPRHLAANTAKTTKTRKRKPIWRLVRILILIIVWVVAIYAGLTVGYVVVGKGPMSDVFHWGTWRHVFDLIFAK